MTVRLQKHADAGAACGDVTAGRVATLAQRYKAVRRRSEALCAPLEVEDMVIQSQPDVSPTRWHLAHTTWFFETFVLLRARPSRRAHHYDYAYLFNSYYNSAGDQFPRPKRGLLSRPTVKEVMAYRCHVDGEMQALLEELDPSSEHLDVIETGLNHEQQHQELILTDIKNVFSCNPLYPVYRKRVLDPAPAVPSLAWFDVAEGLYEIGHDGDGYAYDNEGPRHKVFVPGGQIASRLVTAGEFLAFIEDGGYRNFAHWLSDGWATVQREGWRAPLYWEKQNGYWWQYTLSGLRPVEPAEPVCHVSYFEASAYAAWAKARLPTEAEWEVAARETPIRGNFLDREAFHPVPLGGDKVMDLPAQMFGDVWEWTSSPYTAYPGYRVPPGALGEYNGKFMCNQFVLRGGSCGTPEGHIRSTYRNFWPADARTQFSGIRLAR